MQRLKTSKCYALYSWVPPEHQEVHEMLLNWARWAVNRPHWSHCKSIEHRYCSPQCPGPMCYCAECMERYAREPRIVVDPLQAAELELTIRWLPRTHKQHLKHLYVLRSSYSKTRRLLSLSDNGMANNLKHAREMVNNRLKILASMENHDDRKSA